MKYDKIHVQSHEEWAAWREKHDKFLEEKQSNFPQIKENQDRIDHQQKERKKIFPHTAILEGFYPEHDYVNRWCWQNFGPDDCEKCYDHGSEYPGCPLVLATEYIVKGTTKDKDGTEHPWEEKRYKEVVSHGHKGSWTVIWLGKTDYDFGSAEYCFKEKSDLERFLAAVPSFNLGENYESDHDDNDQ